MLVLFLTYLIGYNNCYNLSYLERETIINYSMIYKALIKYGYSNFKLGILEYYSLSIFMSRELYYLNNLNSILNMLDLLKGLN